MQHGGLNSLTERRDVNVKSETTLGTKDLEKQGWIFNGDLIEIRERSNMRSNKLTWDFLLSPTNLWK